jgi:hypothetical protein
MKFACEPYSARLDVHVDRDGYDPANDGALPGRVTLATGSGCRAAASGVGRER